MRVHGGLVFAVCLGAALLAGGVAGANQPPVADAGLDQTVERNATVYLDAGASYDPDSGDAVRSYRWSLTAPNGTTIEPVCATCERTRFRATATGRYEATITVTGEGGAQRSDTVYVDVQAADPPTVSVTGPASLFTGSGGTATADVSAGDDPLSRLVWSVNGTTVGSEPLDGAGTHERALSFTDSGTHAVTATVTDASGRQASSTHSVDVIEGASPSSGGQATTSGGGFGGARPDASTDFVAANTDNIRSYSDLSFNNYADGDSAITIANTAGPGDITLVSEETAQGYLEPYNWQTVNLGELVEDNLVTRDQADKILKRAKQNQEELDNGAVGGINPCDTGGNWGQSEQPAGLDPSPSPSDDSQTTSDLPSPSTEPRDARAEPNTRGIGNGNSDLSEILAPVGEEPGVKEAPDPNGTSSGADNSSSSSSPDNSGAISTGGSASPSSGNLRLA
jgi:hypothetical protein